jgi:hypothetical protein
VTVNVRDIFRRPYWEMCAVGVINLRQHQTDIPGRALVRNSADLWRQCSTVQRLGGEYQQSLPFISNSHFENLSWRL